MTAREVIAGAPISWGVSEVPGWGHQLSPRRVLTEMREVGLGATELGPDGFLAGPPADRAATLRSHGLTAVGGFVPLVLHDPERDPLPQVAATIEDFRAAGARTLVLAADTGRPGYDTRPDLDDAAWTRLLTTLDAIGELAAGQEVTAVFHPHVGTVVERRSEVLRIIDGCAIPLCLDTGHLLVGGTDPVEIATHVPERVAHTHLKDVDARLARAVREGDRPYSEAVRSGLFRPLGQGDVDVDAIVSALRRAGYRGWYVLEQDVMLAAEPPPGSGPAGDVRASLDYLESLVASPGGGR